MSEETTRLIEFKLQPALLASCAPAMSTEEARYYLMGVHIKRTGNKTIYEATNGHLLIRVTSEIDHETEGDFDIIVPASFVKNLASKAFLKGYEADELTYLDANITGQTIAVETLKGVISHQLVDGTYPQSDKVIPDGKPPKKIVTHIGFNTDYLAKISKSLKALGLSTIAKILIPEDETSATRFEASISEHGEWLAVLMPCRV